MSINLSKKKRDNMLSFLKELKKKNKQKLVSLYQEVKKINNMSFQIFVLSLDWLYLLNVAKIDKNGEVNLCL